MADSKILEVSKHFSHQRGWKRTKSARTVARCSFADEKLKLIEGVVEKTMQKQNLPHIISLNATLDILGGIFGSRNAVFVQFPLITVADLLP